MIKPALQPEYRGPLEAAAERYKTLRAKADRLARHSSECARHRNDALLAKQRAEALVADAHRAKSRAERPGRTDSEYRDQIRELQGKVRDRERELAAATSLLAELTSRQKTASDRFNCVGAVAQECWEWLADRGVFVR